jgi:hypothetical protein
MAIFRGTGGSGSSSDSTIVDAVTAQATIATTKAGEASTSATTATTKASEASTSATTATTKADEANTAKNTAESARDLAQTYKNTALQAASTAGSHANAAEASAQTANSSAVQTVAGSNTQVVGVYNNIANVNTVAGVNTDVTTVAGISSDVTTVAADASDIGTVSTNIANVNNVGNNIANVNAVHGNASNINTVAADGTDIGTVATNIANVNTVAGVSSNVTTVAGLESKMDTVIADASDIGAVAGNIGDVTTVAGINSDVDTVAGIAAKVTTVADNISDVQNADTNATNAATSASNASASATSASNSATTATTKATEASNSATAASNSATTATTKASQAAGSATTAGTSASTATTKASEASASATTATTKAGEAASSASAASGSATTAVTKASEASVSAASAATSATNSSNAASTWNNFYNSYLGTSDAQPSVDVLGNAIVAGALYYDTGAGSNTVGLYVYNGSSWVYSTNYNNVTAPYILAQDLNANGKKIISAGNVGIGTASPTVKLDVETQATGNVASFTGAHPSRNLLITNYTSGGDGSSYAINANSGFGEIKLQTVSNDRIKVANNGDISFYEDTGTTPKFFWDASTERLGIGTTSPATALDVTGTATMDGLTVSDSQAGGVTAQIQNSNSTQTGGSRLDFLYSGSTVTGRIQNRFNGGDFQTDWYTGNHGLEIFTDLAKTEKRLDIASNGDISFYEDTGTTPKFFWDASAERLGIGTTSPSEALEVNGTVKADTHFTSSDTNATLSTSGNGGTVRLRPNGIFSENGQVIVQSSGNVGIGTTSPSSALEVADSGVELKITDTRSQSFTVGDKIASLGFYSNDTSGSSGGANTLPRGAIDVITGNIYGSTHDMVFRTRKDETADASEKLRITSTGNVGIGTTSPARKLTVQGGSSDNLPVRVVGGSGTTKSHMEFQDASTTADYKVTLGSVGDGMSFQAGGSERMRIDSSGNVGIGTTSPDKALTISASDSQVRLYDADGTNQFASFQSDNGITKITSRNNTSHGKIAFQTYNGTAVTERMRIDSSGNLLVGKTATTFGTAGSVSYATGLLTATVDGNACVQLNRLTSDGVIQTFGKDGTTVGSIGTKGGDLYLNTGTTGIKFRDADNCVEPVTNDGSGRDAAIDLGRSSTRFKDLYLSGGVHLGGTTAANKLDDYEEGTWTPTLYGSTSGSVAFTVSGNKYTKVGNLVHFVAYLTNIQASSHNAVGELRIGGLPFVTNTHCAIPHTSYTNCFNFDETDMPVGGYISSGSSFISLRRGSHTTAIDATNFNAVNNQRMMISGTYQTNA